MQSLAIIKQKPCPMRRLVREDRTVREHLRQYKVQEQQVVMNCESCRHPRITPSKNSLRTSRSVDKYFWTRCQAFSMSLNRLSNEPMKCSGRFGVRRDGRAVELLAHGHGRPPTSPQSSRDAPSRRVEAAEAV